MKKALLLLIIAAGLSCKKESEKKYCWKCTTKVTYTPSTVGTGTSTSTVCDMSEEDKEKYEKAGSQTTTSSSGGYTVTMKSTTTCVKQ